MGQSGDLTHVSFGLPLRGLLDDAALAWSFTELCGRHDALRGTGSPLRVVDRTGQPARAEDLADEMLREPFDLTTGPLVRAVLARLAPDHHLLVLYAHPSAASLSSLVVDFAELYATRTAGHGHHQF